MKVVVIASGSKGNCTLVQANNKNFLIDVGINITQLKSALNDFNLTINDIDFVLVTHTHSDHIKGLASFLSKTKADLYSSIEVLEELKGKADASRFHVIDKSFIICGINIDVISLSHDVYCNGFIIDDLGSSLVYITDTGYLNKKYYPILTNKNLYIIESNHDEKMLMEGPYPYILKQRILSDKGHLSNATASSTLRKLVGNDTKYVVLAHISEHNNTKELVYSEAIKELSKTSFDCEKIIISDQYEHSSIIEV